MEIYKAANRVGGGGGVATFQSHSERPCRRSRESKLRLSQWPLIADPIFTQPVIIFFFLSQGPSVTTQYVDPLLALSPLSHTTGTTNFLGLPAVMGFSAADATCQPVKNWLCSPAPTRRYDVSAMRTIYETFASLPPKLAKHSSIITKGYSMHIVQAVRSESTAVPDSFNNLIMAAFIAYEVEGEVKGRADAEGVTVGDEIQRVLAKPESSGLYAYVNCAFGDEGLAAWYGREDWRLVKLRRLKKLWDPQGRLGRYCPIS